MLKHNITSCNWFYFRRMVVLEPLKITIENFPAQERLNVDVPNFPNLPEHGAHTVVFNKVIYIEKSDFMEVVVSHTLVAFTNMFYFLRKPIKAIADLPPIKLLV